MREQILDLALQQMKVGGYKSLSFAKIANTLSTTRANLHHHFRNKEGLAVAATDQYIAQDTAMTEMLFEQFRGDFAGLVCAMEQFVFENVRQNGQVGTCACAQIIRADGIPESLETRAHNFFDNKLDRLAGLVRDSQAAGTISAEVDPTFLAAQASAMLLGLDQMLLATGNPEKLMHNLKGTMSTWIAPYQI